MINQPSGLQTDLLKCSRETREWVLSLASEIEQLKAAKPIDHDVYVQLVSHGMPEGLDGKEQGEWLFSEFDRLREQQAEIERLKTAVASMGRILPLQDADIKRLRDDLADYNARHETSLEVIRVREQEVERQRVEIERLKDDYRRWVSTYHEKLMKAENEIERLNADCDEATSVVIYTIAEVKNANLQCDWLRAENAWLQSLIVPQTLATAVWELDQEVSNE